MPIPAGNTVPLSDNPLIDGLTQGSSWQFGTGSRVVTYSLSLNDTVSGGPWTPFGAEVMQRAFSAWSDIANVTFVEQGSGTVFLASTADIAVTLTGDELQRTMGFVGYSFYPTLASSYSLKDAVYGPNDRLPGDIFLDSNWGGFGYVDAGGIGFTLILHEIGHALGLKHPFDDGANGRPLFTSLGIAGKDTRDYTVMSYNDVSSDPAAGNPSTPMPLDVIAIQQIYGANLSYRTGDDVYTLTGPLKTIWDAGGTDAIDASAGPAATIDLRAGEFSSAGAKLAIAYDVTIENAIGSPGADTITGNDANNRLTGLGGNDMLDGGSGVDTALYASARALYMVTKSAPAVTVSGPDGTDTLTGIERIQFADAVLALSNRALIDFNADVRSDLLWRNSDGSLATWQMNGSAFTGQALGNVASSWRVIDGHGDYNGDGKSDLLWAANDGSIATWHMNGASFSGNFLGTLPTSWSVLDGHGDYNGDGLSDLLLRNSDGTVGVWQMNGGSFTGQVLGVVPLTWSVIDTHGDYNGDGTNDLLWRNLDGTLATWQMTGSAFTGSVLGVVPTSWALLDGHGDYDGDGKSDLLWRSTDGTVATWQMNGGTFSGNVLGTIPASWTLIDAHGDYNGDGKSDLLWRSTDGTVATWQMNGGSFSANVLANVPTTWALLDGHADFNGDGKSDLLWRAADGTVAVWQMNGGTSFGGSVLGVIPLSWNVVDAAELGATISGDTAADVLIGTVGRDTLIGGAGSDTLTGGAGADRFLYTSSAEGVDTISDFSAPGGDALNIHRVLVGYVPGTSVLASFVQLSASGGNTTVSVNADGAGNDFVNLVTLQSVTGLLLGDLVANGNLVV